MTRRDLLAAVPAALAFTSPMPPEAFPWAVDREAHLARRTVTQRATNQASVINLRPLHRALVAFMRRPGDPQLVANARHNLALVHAATGASGLPFAWREMREFCSVLLAARDWHPVS